jgi:aspartyl-tRNA synthetase
MAELQKELHDMVRKKDNAEREAAGAVAKLKQVQSKEDKKKNRKSKVKAEEIIAPVEEVLTKSQMDIFKEITEGNEETDLGRLAFRYAEVRELFYNF